MGWAQGKGSLLPGLGNSGQGGPSRLLPRRKVIGAVKVRNDACPGKIRSNTCRGAGACQVQMLGSGQGQGHQLSMPGHQGIGGMSDKTTAQWVY
jgi:hypothetical protein